MKNFTITGTKPSGFLENFTNGLKETFSEKGYDFEENTDKEIRVVFNIIEPEKPRPFRRKAQATFVISILEVNAEPENTFESAYPYLIRSLANHLIYILHRGDSTELYFVSPEQGFYKMQYGSESDFYENVYNRLEPIASAQLVIDNDFISDLDGAFWDGNETTSKMYESGKKLDGMNLLPAPFPLEKYLNQRDMRQLRKLYGIGGLSYGNLSSRHDDRNFWMSASGIDKSNMKKIGQDILYIKRYNPDKNTMEISIPPNVRPKRASVDAIEHWMIYKDHPDVGAIVHIHAWMDNIEATEVNYPCGTIQLAEAVADLVRKAPDPSRAVIGLKNHGLTITGRDLDDIFDRIDGQIVQQVPMA
ncbi:class II aldolase/adducin family protein [Alkalihalobacillus sp. AL-G]|uniref:class II aldolase/adducin family protein n=1 Tax=Alkalihalobacillus sp. AL-G TaxID=2926399 RepID=UPI00272C7CFE|nr:class II aldolase/adducin family protein [Alkalihalobacillus sp. AL-G]WLD93876.1 class II aldolase/adducin family protein [Alkalihalobacillus sp. AL-G]